ncbi:3-oxoacyl-ACP reductase [Aeromicrobium ginsengisoli]|uniref:3-oxoacyl-ACP reductase n=1 Tax=Aeromicrobium ginsengisoli TaxID=363867 RepID=A0A5M4FH47_9ACTN|nr:3-oxoacyl-ACP reductase [Aeromicrobium ginsengisoli]KAA1399559.1 3-oxoacyl-ACP reductase [Aeromicrobium ginsengisoli]
MADRYQSLAHNPIGKFIVKNLGLPNPPVLERWSEGSPLVKGTVLIGAAPGSRLGKKLAATLKSSGITSVGVRADSKTYKGLVFDATGITDTAGLADLQQFFTPALRSLASSGRLVVIGTLPEQAGSETAAIAQRALEGFVRSAGKEVGGNGSTANLVYAGIGAEDALGSTLEFLLSPKSAFVDGQVIRLGLTELVDADPVADPAKPLAGKVALITGASRGLGEAMARTLHRDGAQIVGLDVPQLSAELEAVMAELGGTAIAEDITAPDAPKVIADAVKKAHGGVDIVVHNAGITRDKRLKNMKTENWNLVIDISVGAPQRITAELLERKLIRPGGRVIGISSIAGIAGNNGQTSYGTAKAGVIGFVNDLSKRVAKDGITVNAIAPGFIETDMVKTMPLGIREAGRRLSSLSQGGQPIDVAEAIAWYANPGSSAISGNVVRVCGQALIGA